MAQELSTLAIEDRKRLFAVLCCDREFVQRFFEEHRGIVGKTAGVKAGKPALKVFLVAPTLLADGEAPHPQSVQTRYGPFAICLEAGWPELCSGTHISRRKPLLNTNAEFIVLSGQDMRGLQNTAPITQRLPLDDLCLTPPRSVRSLCRALCPRLQLEISFQGYCVKRHGRGMCPLVPSHK